VFANVIDIRKKRRSVQIYGVDKKVTTNVAVKQLIMMEFQREDKIAMLR
jgi:hypothetical protein